MDFSQSLNLNTATQKPLFDPTYLNLEYIFSKILNFFRSIFGIYSGETGGSSSQGISFFQFLLYCAILFFIIIIIYCFVRLLEIRKKENEHLALEIEEYAHHHKEKESSGLGNFRNERWENVLGYLSSLNQSDWKLAVMEADSMLEDMTDQMELDGDNLGEKLKASNKEKFKTLDDAWEAHLVRNKIAHEGTQFELSQHEANRVITLYENVFREFGNI
jgi:hypothetical protein